MSNFALIRLYSMIPLVSDFHSGFVVEPYAADVFVELEMLNLG